MKPITILALACLCLAADATAPPPAGTLASPAPVGSSADALMRGLWNGNYTTTFIPPNCQVVVYRQKFQDGHIVPGEWVGPEYFSAAAFVTCDQNGTIPSSVWKGPVLSLYVSSSQAWTPNPPNPPPFSVAPNPGVTPTTNTAPPIPGMVGPDGRP